MENPLSDEQIKTINEIAKLPPEQQKEKLQTFLKTLTPEQIEFLKKQQGQGGCPFCLIVEGKIQSKLIYEDAHVVAVLDIRPAVPGHVLIIPKKHYAVLGQMQDKEVSHLFTVAHKVARLLFETLQAAGTNIFVANGTAAGQTVDHVLVHVIPRFKDDGLALSWQGKELPEEKLEELSKQLIGKIHLQEAAVKKQPVEEVTEKEEERMPDF